MSPPWRRTPPLFLGCRAPPGGACSRREGGDSPPRRGRACRGGEGALTLGFEGTLPVADEVLADAEGACGLGDGVALLGDELDGLGLELGGVVASCAWHFWTSQGDCTPLTGCPRIVGKSTVGGH